MSFPYCYTEDDIEAFGTHYSVYDLDWRWDENTSSCYIAAQRMEEGDSGPLGVKGPCFALYRKTSRTGEVSVVVTPA